MRRPRGEDWSAHLVRYIDGHPNLQPRVGPHGGFVNDRGFEHVTCPTCKNVAVWSPNLNPDVPCAPPGHYLIRDDDGRVVDDICPEA